MHSKSTQMPYLILGSVLPLMYAFKDIATTVILSLCVLLSVVLFELIFAGLKRFWPRQFRFVFALIVLSTVISMIWISAVHLGFDEIAVYIPAGLLSAVILVQSTIRQTLPILLRIKTWTGFLTWCLLTGCAAKWLTAGFSTGLFWLTGFVIMISCGINRKSYYA